MIKNLKNIFPKESEIPSEFKVGKEFIQKQYLIDGEIRTWGGDMQEVLSPISLKEKEGLKRKVLGAYPLLGEKESLEALKSSVAAYSRGKGKWPTLSVEDRIACVEDFMFKMKERREEVVRLLMWEIGKSLKDSRKEFDRTLEYIADTVNALKDLDRTSSKFSMIQGVMAQIKRAPMGIVLCMGPYNYPLNETFTTLLPALIMGNVVIFKPPKYGVLLHGPLLKAFRDSFPKGVVNTVYGDGERVVGPLMKSGKIDVLAFIGSSKVSDILKLQHPRIHRLRSVLGLDAKNAAIVLEDADLDLAVKECVLGSLSFNGQRCTALKMLFVHKSFRNKFTEKFIEEIEKLKVGMPWTEDVFITPLAEDSRVPYLNSLIKDALKNGSEIINDQGGKSAGNLFYPAVLHPIKENMSVYREEQFGPVIPINYFDTINEPMNYVVNSDYGQQVSLFGYDSGKISDLTDVLVNQVCRVNINSQCQRGPDAFPFTGRKDSAEGTLSVSDALKVFSIRTLVAAKENEANKKLFNDIIRGRRSKFISTDFIL